MSEFFCDSLPHMDTDESGALNEQASPVDDKPQLSGETPLMEFEASEVPKLLSEIIKPPPTPPPEPETNATLLASFSNVVNPLAFIEEIKSKNQPQAGSAENDESESPVRRTSELTENTRSPAPPPPPVVVDLKTKTPTTTTTTTNSPTTAAAAVAPEQQTNRTESLRIRTPLVAVAAAAAAAVAAGGFSIEQQQQHPRQQQSANGSKNGGMAVLGEVSDQQKKTCAADLDSPTKNNKDSDSQDGSKFDERESR